MCGIAGQLNFDGAPVEESALRRMAQALVHRGPDGEGVHIDGNVGFAHRRLAIIDPAGGAQPIVDDESGMAITYNGEVYNYLEIRRDLPNANFRTDCDTEVVLRAWQNWGIAALDRFRGMFAFALHDPRSNKVFLVRDRVGIKPLYYHPTPSGLKFASELGALVCDGGGLDVDAEALSLYLRYGYVPTPRTIYRGVHKLEPGHCLAVDLASGRLETSCYWRLDPAIRQRTEPEALEELDSLLRGIIHLYVRSDVPFGAFLSGGVDSSLVTALMGEELSDAVRSFSIGFAEPRYSELPYAEEAARRIGTRHRSETMSAAYSSDLLQRVVARFAEPFADSSCLPTWYVSHLAAKDVKMVLSGDGGDELFAGYNSYPDVLRQSKDRHGASFFGAIAKMAPDTRIGRYAAAKSGSWQATHHGQRDTFSRGEREIMTGRPAPAEADENIDLPAHCDPVTRCQKRDVERYLLDDILVKVDRMSMDNSLEVRVPLLDHKLIEFAFGLPRELRIRRDGAGISQKYLLKRAAERFFPRSFLDRPKWGFGIPLRDWLDGPMKSSVCDLLDSGASRLGPLLDPEAVRRVVREYYSGRRERIGQVWALLSLRLWSDQMNGVRAQAYAAQPPQAAGAGQC